MQDKNNTVRIFSSRLKYLMHAKPWKQRELADAAEIGQSAISNYMQGVRLPGALELLRLSQALGVPMEYLLTDESQQDAADLVCEDPAPYGKKESPWKKRALEAESKLQSMREELTEVLKKI
jgi:transcriptional regulator with XRE-family HTH domain